MLVGRLGIYGKIILKQILKKWYERELTAQDRDLCWAIVNVKINFWAP
jgi:hypothetical protein